MRVTYVSVNAPQGDVYRMAIRTGRSLKNPNSEHYSVFRTNFEWSVRAMVEAIHYLSPERPFVTRNGQFVLIVVFAN